MANNSINLPVTNSKYVSVVIPESDYLNSTDTKPSIKGKYIINLLDSIK